MNLSSRIINKNLQNTKNYFFKKTTKKFFIFSRKRTFLKNNQKFFEPINIGNFQIKIAEFKYEIKRAQSLRYSVFYKEKKAKPKFSQKIFKRDFDIHDNSSDHLLVIDKNKEKNNVIGTYRLLRGSLAKIQKGFYTEQEFDLSNLKKLFSSQCILELGRSCIHLDYRSGLILKLLWQGIAKYIHLYEIKVLIGCASFNGVNASKISDELSYLNYNHSLPLELKIKSTQLNDTCSKLKNYNYSNKNIFSNLPPLIKGYLRVGGMVSSDYYIDYQFNTIDVCILILTDNIERKYKNKFLR